MPGVTTKKIAEIANNFELPEAEAPGATATSRRDGTSAH
jgi:hypothetical protein